MTVTRLARPATTWRGLGPAGQFLIYTRWSGALIGPVMLAGLFTPMMFENLLSTGQLILLVAVMLIGFLPVVRVFDLHPDLNIHPRGDHGRWMRIAAWWHGLVWVVSAVAILVLGPASRWSLVAALAIVGATVALNLAVIPELRLRWVLSVLLSVASGALIEGPAGGFWFVVALGVFACVTSVGTLWMGRLMQASDRARVLEAELKVSEERLRFAQELHDTLGQHLAAISLKAELAQALARRQDPRLFDELTTLQQLAGTSLAEMRQVVDGYRTVNLATEVEGARALLRDAAVPLTVVGDSFEVPAAHRELAAWFVREVTTNVLRHADASEVTLSLTPDAVTMCNDGVGDGGVEKQGGLDTLRRRAERSGASMHIDRDGEYFTVALHLGGTP